MLTENYIKKINPLIKIYKFIYKFRYLLITTSLLLVTSLTTLISIKGIVYKDLEVKDIVYGQKLEYQAKTIFSDTSYEFKKITDSSWSSEEPVNAGEYEIRAVGKNIFGMKVHGNAHKFTISPKKIKPTVIGNSYMYGENPLFSFDLAYEDRLAHQGYHYEGLSTIPMYAFEEDDFLIVNSEGKDVTANYSIDLSSINATLTPRGVVVKINESKGYDGNPLVLPNDFEITSGTLINNDYIVADKVTDYTNVGEYKPEFELYFNNVINGDVSKLYNYSFTNDSVCEIEKRSLTISTPSLRKTYDGIVTDLNSYEITSGSLVTGETIDVIFNQYVDVGEYQNEPYYFKIHDEDGNDTTNNYDITFNYGNVVIDPQEIEITTSNVEFDYNGENQASYDYEITKGRLVNNDQIIVRTMTTTEIINKGEYENALDFDIINANFQSNIKNYDVTVKYGTIKINPINLTIETSNMSVTYGESINENELKYSISSGSLANGDMIVIDSINLPEKLEANNSYDNKIEIKIYHNGNLDDERTSNYNISYKYGKINVTKRPLELSTGSSEFFYQNGYEYSYNNFNIISGSLAYNDILKGIDYTTISEIGSKPNIITPLIIDEYANDVTSNYDVVVSDYGTLTVKEDINTIPPSMDDEDDKVDNNPSIEEDNDYKVSVDLEINDSNNDESIIPPEEGEGGENPDNPGQEDGGEDNANSGLLFTYNSNGNTPIYLRQNVYGNYFNGALYQAKKYSFNGTSYFDPNLYVGNLIKDNKEVKQIDLVLNKDFSSGFIPYYLASEATYFDNDVDINFNNEKNISFSYYEYNYLNEGLNLANLDYIYQNNLNYLNYETFVNNNYLKVETSLRLVIETIINDNNLKKESEFDSIYSVGRFLKNNYVVGTDVKYEGDTDIIKQFLTMDKKGKAQHFATAGAMILRTIGIPARVVSGYYLKNDGIETEVYKSQADHVWVEAYSDDLKAWINVDFTPAYAIDYTPENPTNPDGSSDDNDGETIIPGGNEGSSGEGGNEGTDEEDPDKPVESPGDVDEEFPRDEIENTIYLTTGSKSFTYDGELHKYENYTIESGELLPYDKLEVTFLSSILNYGTIRNRISYKIYDTRNNKEVTNEYQDKILINYGVLSIDKTPLTVSSNSIEKTYDGELLYPTINDLSFNQDELKNNDYIDEVLFYNIKSERGVYINLFEIKSIRNGMDNRNLIANYQIYYTYGTITIS